MDPEALKFNLCVHIGHTSMYLRVKRTLQFRKFFNYMVNHLGLWGREYLIEITTEEGTPLGDGLLVAQGVEEGDKLHCEVAAVDTYDAGLYFHSPTNIPSVMVIQVFALGVVVQNIRVPGTVWQSADTRAIEWSGSLVNDPDELAEWEWEDYSLLQERETGDIGRYLRWNLSLNTTSVPPEGGSTISTHWNLSDENAVILRFNEVAPYIVDAMDGFPLYEKDYKYFFLRYYSRFVKQTYVAVRFLEQAVYEQVAPLSVSPAPDVIVRVVLLFRKVKEREVAKWPAARERFKLGPGYWKDIVGVDQRADDQTLYRVTEWRAVEVTS